MNAFRGAPMGRPDSGEATATPLRFSLTKIRLNRGGYDSTGAYWGIGAALYYAADDTGEHERWFRASDRDDAKEIIRESFAGARFYR